MNEYTIDIAYFKNACCERKHPFQTPRKVQFCKFVTWAMRPSSGLSKDTHKPTGLHLDFSCAWFRAPGGLFRAAWITFGPQTRSAWLSSTRRISREVTAVRSSVQHGQLLFAPRFEEPAVFPPLLLLYLLLDSTLFGIVFVFFFCIIVVFFRQREPRCAVVANFRLAS